MKILFVVPYVPSKIYSRSYNLIRSLNERGHKVTVATLWTKPEELDALQELSQFTQKVISLKLPRWRSLLNSLMALPTKKPLQAVYCWQPRFAAQLTSIIQPENIEDGFDVIHVEHLRGVDYALQIKRLIDNSRTPHLSPTLVWDSVDSISHLFRQASHKSQRFSSRLLTRFELHRTERYEAWLVKQFSTLLVTSKIDKQALVDLAQSHGENINIIPNGVDLNYFTKDPDTRRDTATLVISGKMSYHANVSMVMYMVKQVLPIVWQTKPDVKLIVVGKNPSREILEFQQHPEIEVTGTVPDLRPYLRKATLAVAPLTYGAGIQFKVLEAMACGTPVIASSRVTRPLDLEIGRDIITADNPGDFARAITELLGDPDRRESIGQSGWSYVQKYHSWAKIAAQLENVYRGQK